VAQSLQMMIALRKFQSEGQGLRLRSQGSLLIIFPKFYSWNTRQKYLQNCHQRERTNF